MLSLIMGLACIPLCRSWLGCTGVEILLPDMSLAAVMLYSQECYTLKVGGDR